MKNKTRKIGKFKIILPLFEDHLDEIIDIFRLLKIIPVKAEILYEDNSIHYTALSPFFDEIKYNESPPKYEILMTKEKGKIISVKFQRVIPYVISYTEK